MKETLNTAQTTLCTIPSVGGNNFINNVACIDWQEGIKQVLDSSVDLVVTDPPYGMKFQSNHRKVKYKSIQNDDNLDWLGDWCKQLKRVCKPEAHIYVFCSWHNVDLFKQELEAYFQIKNILIWEKNNTGMGDLEGDYAPKYEMIIFCSNGTKKLNGGRDANILKSKRTGNKNHPTEKPVNLISYLLEKSSNKGDLVLDTFAGSFSTAQACKQKQRNWICFEIDPEYCKIAKNCLMVYRCRFFSITANTDISEINKIIQSKQHYFNMKLHNYQRRAIEFCKRTDKAILSIGCGSCFFLMYLRK